MRRNEEMVSMKTNIEKLKSLYNQIKDKESALSMYCISILRMLKGLTEMKDAQFYSYENTILYNAMNLFAEHFMEQVKQIQDTRKVSEKRELLNDIEEAVYVLSCVYKNVIDGTANSDRRMMSSLAINTNLYDLSPKYCAFYSGLLNKAVQMFRKEGIEYAFILHPTMRHMIEAQPLLEKREKSGKVVVLYLPENMIEDIDTVLVNIFHEAFHILTKKSRHRRERGFRLITSMSIGCKMKIFEDIDFYDEAMKGCTGHSVSDDVKNEINTNIENRLWKYWFKGVDDFVREIRDRSETDICFYSSRFRGELVDHFVGYLCDINPNQEGFVIETILDYIDPDIGQLEQIYKNLISICERLKKNINHLVRGNEIDDYSYKMVKLYRETYADLGSLLLTQAAADSYKKTFAKAKQFDFSDEEYMDVIQAVRIATVANIICDYSSETDKEGWKQLGDITQHKLEYFSAKEQRQNEGSETISNGGDFLMNKEMQEELLGYLNTCALDLYKEIQGINKIDEFRAILSSIKDSPEEFRKNILLGKSAAE